MLKADLELVIFRPQLPRELGLQVHATMPMQTFKEKHKVVCQSEALTVVP